MTEQSQEYFFDRYSQQVTPEIVQQHDLVWFEQSQQNCDLLQRLPNDLFCDGRINRVQIRWYKRS